MERKDSQIKLNLNNRVGCFLESNKIQFFNSITDWSMKNLLLSMSNLITLDIGKNHSKEI